MVCFNVDVHLFLFSGAVLSSETQTAAFFVRCHSSQSRYPSGLRLAPPPLQEEKKQLLHLQVLKLDSLTKPSFPPTRSRRLHALHCVCVCVCRMSQWTNGSKDGVSSRGGRQTDDGQNQVRMTTQRSAAFIRCLVRHTASGCGLNLWPTFAPACCCVSHWVFFFEQTIPFKD